jgi:hypothetical protein
MDINGFRTPQSPWFFSNTPTPYAETQAINVSVPRSSNTPTPDNRYPGFVASMNDGRIFTDFRSKCEVNIPSGSQFAVTRFLQHNANSIISQSRKRQAARAAAGSYYDSSTVPPHSLIQSCTEYSCSVSPGTKGGIGLTRHEEVPFLFGTFAESGCTKKESKPLLTQSQEGGRNSVRGVFTSLK